MFIPGVLIVFVFSFIVSASLVLAAEPSPLVEAKLLAQSIPEPVGSATTDCDGLIDFFADINICLPYQVGTFSIWLFSWLAGLTGKLLDIAIQISIFDITDYFQDGGIVETLWQTVRDLANIIFIFALLWISIQTILGLDNAKKYLATIIISALLINFSLFFTKVIIDASNILAVQFYSAIVPSGCNTEDRIIEGCISQKIIAVSQLSTIYGTGQNDDGINIDRSTFSGVVIVSVMGTIFILSLVVAFLLASFIFIGRTVAFIVLGVVSPLAFVGRILPQTAGLAKQWWTTLTSQALTAPIFLFFLWIMLKVAEDVVGDQSQGGLVSRDGNTISSSLLGGGDFKPVFYFIFLMILLFYAIKTTQDYAGSIGKRAVNIGSKGLGMASGIGGLVGRQLGSRAFGWAAGKISGNNPVSRYTRDRLTAASGASFDFRNLNLKSALGGLGIKGDLGKGFERGADLVGDSFGEALGGMGATLDTGKPYNAKETSRERAKKEKDDRDAKILEKKESDLEKLKNVNTPTDAQKILDDMTDTEVSELPSDILQNRHVMEKLTPGMLAKMVDKLKGGPKGAIATYIKNTPGHPAYDYLVNGPGKNLW